MSDIIFIPLKYSPPGETDPAGEDTTQYAWLDYDEITWILITNIPEFPVREWPDEDLILDELEALLLVIEAHAQDMPADHPAIESVTLHALVHTLTETQLALDDPDFHARLEQLLDSGLSRHQAIHRLGGQLVRVMLQDSLAPQLNQRRRRGHERPRNLQN